MIEPSAQDDLSALFLRNPTAYGWALSAIHAALQKPHLLDRKGKRLDDYWSLVFPADQEDTKNRGRVVVDFDGITLNAIAVDEDHDRAYAKAKKRAVKKR